MKKRFVLLILISGCAAPGPEQPAEPEAPPAISTPPSENVAVASLMDNARADVAANKLGSAAATLERALRIEPRNPRLWHELARVRLRQGQFAQAESVAARSNSWAGDDRGLRAENWRLIAQSREARGDREGAKAALDNSIR